ncbi:MAG TPA: PAS domain-containing protein [Gemmatimonadales bacterium]|nr:PAS domain-containing protein [Gemmatimonadales bacterium]
MTSLELSEAQSLWRLLDAIPHVVWVVDGEGHAEFLNRAGRDSLSGAASVPADVAWSRAVHPEDAWHLQHEWASLRSSQQSFQRSVRLRLAEGEYRACQLHATISMGMWVLTCTPLSRDGEETAQAPEDAQLTARRFRSLVDALSEFVWITDANGEVGYNISGGAGPITPEVPAVTFTAWLDRVHPEDRDRLAQTWREAMRTGVPVTVEYRLVEADGTIRNVVVRGVPVHSRDGVIEEWVGVLIDITAGRTAETELRRSERRYRTLATAFSELVWTTDAEGHPTGVIGGDAFVEPGQILSAAEWAELMHPEDREWAVHEFATAIRSGLPLDSKYRVRRRNGSYCHVVSRGLPVRDQQGKIEEWVGVVVDVTSEREATLALERTVCELELSRHRARQDHALLETLIAAAPIGIAFVDTQFRLLNANPAIINQTGPTETNNVLGMRLQELVPESWARVGTHLEQVLDTGRPILNVPTSSLRPDGRMQHRLSSFYPVRSRGRVIGIGIVVLDVTSQKDAEQALERERYFLDLILQSVDDGILVCNSHGMLTKVNRSSRAYHGMSVPALVPYREWTEHYHLYHPDGTRMTVEELPLYRAWKGETISGTELEIRAPGHPPRLMLVRGRPLTGPNGESYGAVVVTQDITEKRELETRLRQAQKMDAVGQLAGGVAHDFNNLLTVVAGASELLLDRLDPGTEAYHLVQEIALAGERATGLTRQLLAFGRRTVVAPQVVRLNEIVGETDRLLRRLLGEDIELITSLAEDMPPVRVDTTQIAQVLVNLAVNARDAMPQGGTLTIETGIRQVDEHFANTHPEVAPGRFVVLTVSDTGCGMSEEVRRHVFEPFFTTKPAGRGTGLGLATVYGIVKQAGGLITVDSTVGRGTSFQILLPIAEVERVTAPQPVVDDARAHGHEKILLVEDEAAVRALAREALASHGYSVVEASNAAEALVLAAALNGDLDLLVTDVVMPGMGGLELSQQIRATKPGLKVLFVSGYTDDAMVRHGVMAAEVDLLQKPFGATALAARVRQVLDAHRA